MVRLIPLILLLTTCFCELITVKTSRGSVQGFDKDLGDDKSQLFYGYGQIFLGIPFAKPPLRERRFMLPEDICQYNERGEIHNATYYRPRCVQPSQPTDKTSEDCFYLNVMSPNITGTHPVMVYIHGGSFTTGGAETFHWKGAIRNLLSRGVVVVTIQYRLGFLGFFTTYTENFPPNRGLYDQILALRWVNEEIANFGGDPSRVTLFGQSAGAISVSDLSLSPLARGLFHQTIQESGSTLLQIETITDKRGSIHQDRARQICNINSTDWGSNAKDQALLSCLLEVSSLEFLKHELSDAKNWNVAIDGAILPDYPENLAKNRPQYPTMLGDMLDDFAGFIPGVAAGDVSSVTEKLNVELFKAGWPGYDEATAKHVSDIMVNGYTNGSKPAAHDHLGWTKLISTMVTGWGYGSYLIREAQWHQAAGNDKLWLFTFVHRSLLPFNLRIDDWTPVMHSSERPFLWFFPDKWENFNASDTDLAVAEYMGVLWTEFAKNGELPIPKAGEDLNYLEIGDTLSLKSNWRGTANEVFNKQIPSFLGEFPMLTMPDEAWTKVKEMGEKVVAKWNSMQKCINKL